jgi:hypothetical protein
MDCQAPGVQRAAPLAGNLVKRFGGEIQETLPVTSLTQNLARIAVISLGVLILLNLRGESSNGGITTPRDYNEPALARKSF